MQAPLPSEFLDQMPPRLRSCAPLHRSPERETAEEVARPGVAAPSRLLIRQQVAQHAMACASTLADEPMPSSQMDLLRDYAALPATVTEVSLRCQPLSNDDAAKVACRVAVRTCPERTCA
jgi:hypothetical protein